MSTYNNRTNWYQTTDYHRPLPPLPSNELTWLRAHKETQAFCLESDCNEDVESALDDGPYRCAGRPQWRTPLEYLLDHADRLDKELELTQRKQALDLVLWMFSDPNGSPTLRARSVYDDVVGGMPPPWRPFFSRPQRPVPWNGARAIIGGTFYQRPSVSCCDIRGGYVFITCLAWRVFY